MANRLRDIPSVNELLASPPLRQLVDRANRSVVVSGVRTFLDNLRDEVSTTAAEIHMPSVGELAERIADWIRNDQRPNLRPVINATGILLHTGLGRAPLAKSAIDAMTAVAAGYASVEVDVASGQRSQRTTDVERLLQKLTGAEAATVVNNNAGATLLALSTLARDREVIVSRGQLVEIGGSYRLPDVMEFSGARLREIGTTNRTRIGDFSAAIRENTAALMRVHTSNYAIVGFTEQPTLGEMVKLARKHSLPVIDDIGSGAISDLTEFGATDEPLVVDSVRAGADVVLFSGDKLLGGPQCGIIVGRRELVDRIVAHPLMRALRVDKLTLSALLATLQAHQDRETALNELPLYALLATPLANLQNRAERLAPQLANAEAIESAEAVAGETYLGGGSVPSQRIETWCVALQPKHISLDALSGCLRLGQPPIFGRIHKDRLLLDLRTVYPSQDAEIASAVERLDAAPSDSDAPCD